MGGSGTLNGEDTCLTESLKWQIASLMMLLAAVFRSTKKDEWIWKPEPSGQYSVRTAYNMLKGVDVEEDNMWVFEELWKIRVPPKLLFLHGGY